MATGSDEFAVYTVLLAFTSLKHSDKNFEDFLEIVSEVSKKYNGYRSSECAKEWAEKIEQYCLDRKVFLYRPTL